MNDHEPASHHRYGVHLTAVNKLTYTYDAVGNVTKVSAPPSEVQT